MGESTRTITLIVALATLSSNILSTLLFENLPDDPFHLARNFGWYLHFANLLSIFGLIGALREHALSVTVFANYLILDTILCSIPRFLILGLLRTFKSDLCTPSSSLPLTAFELGTPHQSATFPQAHITSHLSTAPDLPYTTSQWDSFSSTWSHDGCLRIVTLGMWTLAAGVVAGTLLQFVGALYVRGYGRMLWVREMREEEERWLGGVGVERAFRDVGVVEGEFVARRLSVIEERDESYVDEEKM